MPSGQLAKMAILAQPLAGSAPGPRPLHGLAHFAAEVVRVERPKDDLVLLCVRMAPEQQYGFQAGQFAFIQDDRPGMEARKRAYSIASPPSSLPEMEFCVKVANWDGTSGWLYNRSIGDTLRISKPLGAFTMKSPTGRKLAFLAGGTGVAPFRAMLLDELAKGSQRELVLILGSRHPEGLPYHREFLELSNRYPNFQYEPTVTRPSDDWTGPRGWPQHRFAHLFGGQKDRDVYICGVKDMVADSRAVLTAQGVPDEQVHWERYD